MAKSTRSTRARAGKHDPSLKEIDDRVQAMIATHHDGPPDAERLTVASRPAFGDHDSNAHANRMFRFLDRAASSDAISFEQAVMMFKDVVPTLRNTEAWDVASIVFEYVKATYDGNDAADDRLDWLASVWLCQDAKPWDRWRAAQALRHIAQIEPNRIFVPSTLEMSVSTSPIAACPIEWLVKRLDESCPVTRPKGRSPCKNTLSEICCQYLLGKVAHRHDLPMTQYPRPAVPESAGYELRACNSLLGTISEYQILQHGQVIGRRGSEGTAREALRCAMKKAGHSVGRSFIAAYAEATGQSYKNVERIWNDRLPVRIPAHSDPAGE